MAPSSHSLSQVALPHLPNEDQESCSFLSTDAFLAITVAYAPPPQTHLIGILVLSVRGGVHGLEHQPILQKVAVHA